MEREMKNMQQQHISMLEKRNQELGAMLEEHKGVREREEQLRHKTRKLEEELKVVSGQRDQAVTRFRHADQMIETSFIHEFLVKLELLRVGLYERPGDQRGLIVPRPPDELKQMTCRPS